jgi:adenylate cyclase
VRGIQEIIIATSMASNIFSFKYLLGYFAFMAVLGFGFIVVQRRLIRTIDGMNRRLESTNDVLANVARNISRYLAPQVYSSIFSGKREVAIQTERKKLTVFFSDIEDFTGTTERLQPEEITSLLNEYLTEMSNIAAKYGGTLNKFIGDAIVIFFGDPETKGATEDAKACLAMAVHMQGRMAELNAQWRRRGIEHPFRVRMGINAGYCNVGNFGSEDRMDYTIIGAEANLAQRLQSIAEPGHIVLSYEAYMLVREMVSAHALPSITVKGIHRQIVPYLVDGLLDATGTKIEKFSEHAAGLDFYLDLGAVDDAAEARIRGLLQDAIAALDRRRGPSKLA